MKNSLTTAFVATVLLALLAPLAQAQSASANSVKDSPLLAEDAYIRTMPPGRTVTAGFLKLTNTGDQPCQITDAESPISDRLEFHEHLHTDGMMRMRPVSGGLSIAAGETLIFKPGGLHIMLFNIQQPLEAGENTPLQLNTDQCGSLQIDAEIRSLVAKPMGGMHH
ncbi:MAG: copper chaperone PCu(A)C [Porticoccaceae bacterium]